MNTKVAYYTGVTIVGLALFATVGLLDSQAAQEGRVKASQTAVETSSPATPSPVATAVSDPSQWPACEDTLPGQACQYFDDFDSDGDNTVAYFPHGM